MTAAQLAAPGQRSGQRRLARRLGACVALALAGTLAHNALEFGLVALLSAETFSVPWTVIWTGLLVAWNRMPSRRRGIELTMLWLALVSLIGGAIGTVLPLAILPFDPEQSFHHYVSHLVYASTQLPLVVLLGRTRE